MRLAWGEGLLSFKPEANLAGQIAQVEVYGWDREAEEDDRRRRERRRGIGLDAARARASA